MNRLKNILMSTCCVLLLACGAGPTEKMGVAPESGASALELRGAEKPRPPAARMHSRTEPSPLIATLAPLSNGVPVPNISGVYDSVQYWSIEVPAGTASLEVTTDSGSGDADLYVRHGELPKTIRSGAPAYDCLGYSGSPFETCIMENPQAGTWYILVHGYTAFTGVTLTATHRRPTALGSWNANIELARPACTLVEVSGFPSVCFNPGGLPNEPGITLTYKLPGSGGTVTGTQNLTSDVGTVVLYNTLGNQSFAPATFEEISLAFPEGAPTSQCRNKLAIVSSPAPAAGWPRMAETGGATRVESGEPWGGTGFPTYDGVNVTPIGLLTYKHPCRTTVRFKAQ